MIDRDELSYNYLSLSGLPTNRLGHVTDGVSSSGYTDDFEPGQTTNNYVYDEMGGLVTDVAQDIDFEYYPSGLVKTIYKKGTATPKLSFLYSDAGKRLKKTSYDGSGSPAKDTWYIGDAIYEKDYADPTPLLYQTTVAINGNGKLGSGLFGIDGSNNRELNQYVYELKDHLGNIRALIDSRKNFDNKVILYSFTDYYPYGGEMPGLIKNLGQYRYGYQGQEQDEITGLHAFELRMYNKHLGRWLRTDPYYQHWSPYLAMSNNPISFIDPDGGCDDCAGEANIDCVVIQDIGPNKNYYIVADNLANQNYVRMSSDQLHANVGSGASMEAIGPGEAGNRDTGYYFKALEGREGIYAFTDPNRKINGNSNNYDEVFEMVQKQSKVGQIQAHSLSTGVNNGAQYPSQYESDYLSEKENIENYLNFTGTVLSVIGTSAEIKEYQIYSLEMYRFIRDNPGKFKYVNASGIVRTYSLNFYGNQYVSSVRLAAQKTQFWKSSLQLQNRLKWASRIGTVTAVLGGIVSIADIFVLGYTPKKGFNLIMVGVGAGGGPLGMGLAGFWFIAGHHLFDDNMRFQYQTGGADKWTHDRVGCFLKGTKITMASGHQIPIEMIQINDTVKTYNLELNEFQDALVLKMDSVIHHQIGSILFSNSVVNQNSLDHPYYVVGKGWSSLLPSLTATNYGFITHQLEVGDSCYLYINGEIEITIIAEIIVENKQVVTYNLTEVSKNHNFFANGILVHNKTIFYPIKSK